MTKLVFSLLAIAGLPAFLYAVDGQVLINQATVVNSGGFPYHITQPGSYKLSGNLTVPAGSFVDGIDIGADNVTLDLNGFTITGAGLAGGAAGVGSGGSNRSGITVKNGSVTNFITGIDLPGSSLLLTDLHLNSNLRGMHIGEGGAGNIVVRCTANSNAQEGMMVFNATVSDSGAAANGKSGLYASNSTLFHNILEQNGQAGILATNAVYGSNTILNNSPDVLGGTSQNNNLCTSGGC